MLRQLGHRLNIQAEHCFLQKGRLKPAIKRLAHDLHIDNVVTEDTPTINLYKK